MKLKKGILILSVSDVVLLMLLILSLVFSTGKNVPVSMESALLNPKYTDDVCVIEITDCSSSDKDKVVMTRRGSFWTGTSSISDYTMAWPCDTQTVNNFILSNSKIEKMNKVGENSRSWKRLGVDESNCILVSMYNDSGTILSSIYYGKSDPLTQKVAFRTWRDDSVYEVTDSILVFIKTEESFWADPFVYPQCITGLSRRESEGFLRRGVLSTETTGNVADHVIRKDFGNGAEAIYRIYRKDDSYIVVPSFRGGIAYSDVDKETVESLNYRYSISAWTLDKFLKESEVGGE